MFLYLLDELLHMDFWNTIEEIKEQYLMKIRSAVLEILEEGRRTGRNVEYQKQIIVNFNYEISENSYKKNLYCFFDLLAYRNVASKVLRTMATVLMHSTCTRFTKIVSATSLYLQQFHRSCYQHCAQPLPLSAE